MTTSAEQLSAAITAMTELADTFNGKKEEIDASVQAALASGPDISRYYSIDQAAGDDTGTGSVAQPLASFEEAILRTPEGGVVSCRLTGPYTIDTDISLSRRRFYVYGWVGTMASLNVSALNTDAASPYTPGFIGHNWELVTHMKFQNLTINLGAGATGRTGLQNGAFKGPNNLFIGLTNCEITMDVDTELSLIGLHGNLFMETKSLTVPAEIAGHWITDVAAGTDPATLPTVFTDLVSL